jgi:serine protease DegQ
MNGRKTNRTPLYSRSARDRPGTNASAPAAAAPGQAAPLAAEVPAAASAAPRGPRMKRRLPPWGWAFVGALLVALPVAWLLVARPLATPLTQERLDAAVLHSLQTQPLPAPAAKAFAAVQGSLVRVVGLQAREEAAPAANPPKPDAKKPKLPPAPGKPERKADKGGDKAAEKGQAQSNNDAAEQAAAEPEETGVGSGVVIVDTGIILTNLHVVAGAKRIKVVFADGLESEASVINVMPENDLAVLRAHRIPDDLQAATMRSTGDLHPGDRVTAVGFPFGIGPSVSHGVVSGLKREFRSPEGKQQLTNLIQFDAMANPGSSGGPLVTDDGAVVGIVTAILNPVQERFFVGIGFAVPIENAAAGAGMPPF